MIQYIIHTIITHIYAPGLSASNRMMTYPLAGTLTVSLIGGSMRLTNLRKLV